MSHRFGSGGSKEKNIGSFNVKAPQQVGAYQFSTGKRRVVGHKFGSGGKKERENLSFGVVAPLKVGSYEFDSKKKRVLSHRFGTKGQREENIKSFNIKLDRRSGDYSFSSRNKRVMTHRFGSTGNKEKETITWGQHGVKLKIFRKMNVFSNRERKIKHKKGLFRWREDDIMKPEEVDTDNPRKGKGKKGVEYELFDKKMRIRR